MTLSSNEAKSLSSATDAGSLLSNLVDILNFVIEGEAEPITQSTLVGDIITDRGIAPAALVEIISDQYGRRSMDQGLIQPDDTLATLSWRVHQGVTGDTDF